jgi:hypothetical protein
MINGCKTQISAEVWIFPKEVLEPLWFRDEMTKKIKRMWDNYKKKK